MVVKSYSEYVLDTVLLILDFLIVAVAIINRFEMFYTLLLVFGVFLLLKYMITIVDKNKLVSILLFTGIAIDFVVFCFLSKQWYSVVLWLTVITLLKQSSLNKRCIQYIAYLFPLLIFCSMQLLNILGLNIQSVICTSFLLIIILIVYRAVSFYHNKFVINQMKNEEILSKFALNELFEKNLNKELAIKNYLIEKNTRLEEREIISRNIHNSVGHTITAAIMALEAAEVLSDVSPQRAKEKVEVANSRMHESLNGIRQAVRVLDNETESLSTSQFLEILISSINELSMDTDIKIRHNLSMDNIASDIEIDKKHAQFLNSAMLEAFSNGVRHGRATAFIVMIYCDGNNLQLSTQDNGTEFSKLSSEIQLQRIKNGFGLKKIKSYLENCGGELKLSFDDGFSTTFVIPIV